MLDIAKTLTASASIQALAGSSRPGAVPPLVPLGAATGQPACRHAGDTTCRHVDAEVVELAARVTRLARRDHNLWDRRAAIEDAVLVAMPALPNRPEEPIHGTCQEVEADGMRITTVTVPTTPDPAYLEASAVFDAAVAERGRLEAEMEARLGYPRLEKLSKRTFARLTRWTERLALMMPQTQAGLRAKAEVQRVLAETGNAGDWVTDFAGSVSRDALRVIGAEADARYQEDQARDGELLALGRAWKDCAARHDHAFEGRMAAEERAVMPTPPEALFLDPRTDPPVLGAYSRIRTCTDRHWYGDASTINQLRKSWHHDFCLPRRDEILATFDAWTAEQKVAAEAAGIPAATEAVDRVAAEHLALRRRILAISAHTLDGLKLKMAVARWCSGDIDVMRVELEDFIGSGDANEEAFALAVLLDASRVLRTDVDASAVPASDVHQARAAASAA